MRWPGQLEEPAWPPPDRRVAAARPPRGRRLTSAWPPPGVQVEEVLGQLEELSRAVEAVLHKEEGVPPPPEPRALATYTIAVHTRAAHAARSEAATLRLYTRPLGAVDPLPVDIDLNEDNLLRTAPSAAPADGKGRKAAAPAADGLFQSGNVDIFTVQFAEELGDLADAEIVSSVQTEDW